MIELEELCQAYHIELHSVQSIKESLAQYHLPFTSRHYETLYKYNNHARFTYHMPAI